MRSFEDSLNAHKSELTEALIVFGEHKRVNKVLAEVEMQRPEFYKFYKEGRESRQTEVDELNQEMHLVLNNWNDLTNAIHARTNGTAVAEARQLYEKVDELQKRVDALTLALDQIAYPIPHMQKEAELNGCELNGYWAVKMSEDHTYSKDIARRALEKEQALKGGGDE